MTKNFTLYITQLQTSSHNNCKQHHVTPQMTKYAAPVKTTISFSTPHTKKHQRHLHYKPHTNKTKITHNVLSRHTCGPSKLPRCHGDDLDLQWIHLFAEAGGEGLQAKLGCAVRGPVFLGVEPCLTGHIDDST